MIFDQIEDEIFNFTSEEPYLVAEALNDPLWRNAMDEDVKSIEKIKHGNL